MQKGETYRVKSDSSFDDGLLTSGRKERELATEAKSHDGEFLHVLVRSHKSEKGLDDRQRL